MKWWWDSQTKMSFMFCTGHNHAFNAKQWHGALNYVVLYWIQGHKRYKGIVLNKVHIVQWHGALDYVVHGGDLSSSHRTTHLPLFFQSCVCTREAFQKRERINKVPKNYNWLQVFPMPLSESRALKNIYIQYHIRYHFYETNLWIPNISNIIDLSW